MTNSERVVELQAAIAAVDAEIEAVMRPLKERRAQLASELHEIKMSEITALYGVSVGDLLRPTDMFASMLKRRGGWSESSLQRFIGAKYLTLCAVNIDKALCDVSVEDSGSKTGNVPIEMIRSMRDAWLRAPAESETDNG